MTQFWRASKSEERKRVMGIWMTAWSGIAAAFKLKSSPKSIHKSGGTETISNPWVDEERMTIKSSSSRRVTSIFIKSASGQDVSSSLGQSRKRAVFMLAWALNRGRSQPWSAGRVGCSCMVMPEILYGREAEIAKNFQDKFSGDHVHRKIGNMQWPCK